MALPAWSVKGIEKDVRELAKVAAAQKGQTLAQWLEAIIFKEEKAAVSAFRPTPPTAAANDDEGLEDIASLFGDPRLPRESVSSTGYEAPFEEGNPPAYGNGNGHGHAYAQNPHAAWREAADPATAEELQNLIHDYRQRLTHFAHVHETGESDDVSTPGEGMLWTVFAFAALIALAWAVFLFVQFS